MNDPMGQSRGVYGGQNFMGGGGGGMRTNGPESLGLWNGQPFDPNNNPWEAMRGGGGVGSLFGGPGYSLGNPNVYANNGGQNPGGQNAQLPEHSNFGGSQYPGMGQPQGTGNSADHMKNFLQEFQQNPGNAYAYTNLDPSVSQWFQQNQGNIQQQAFGGDVNAYNKWINDSSYNAQAPDAQAMNRMRGMAGLKPIDAWRFATNAGGGGANSTSEPFNPNAYHSGIVPQPGGVMTPQAGQNAQPLQASNYAQNIAGAQTSGGVMGGYGMNAGAPASNNFSGRRVFNRPINRRISY